MASDIMADFHAPVFKSDLKVTADEGGDIEIHGASENAVSFLLAIQQGDLEQVREMYVKDPDQEKALRGYPPLGQEIANRAAQITRQAVEAGMVTYSERDEQWVLDELRVRTTLFRGSF